MPDDVKARSYRSPVRTAQAAATRQRILDAARALLEAQGYEATSVTALAEAAGVSVDTLYTAVGRKPQIVLAVIDDLLGGEQAAQRAYVREIQAEPSAVGKVAVYAQAASQLVPRIAPLQDALRKAGESDAACATAWRALTQRRARNMLQFAQELRGTGDLRPDLGDRQVADIIWSTNASEFWGLFQQRGWTPQEYGAFLADMWTRMLLVDGVRSSG